jgi:hypothetical protein
MATFLIVLIVIASFPCQVSAIRLLLVHGFFGPILEVPYLRSVYKTVAPRSRDQLAKVVYRKQRILVLLHILGAMRVTLAHARTAVVVTNAERACGSEARPWACG